MVEEEIQNLAPPNAATLSIFSCLAKAKPLSLSTRGSRVDLKLSFDFVLDMVLLNCPCSVFYSIDSLLLVLEAFFSIQK